MGVDSGSGSLVSQAYARLTLALISSVRQVFDEDGLDRLLARRAGEQAAAYAGEIAGCANLGAQVEALAAVRTREGYMARVEVDEDGSLLLVENHCPICIAARACIGLCQSEVEVFRLVLGPEVRLERSDHIVAGDRRCAYRVSFE